MKIPIINLDTSLRVINSEELDKMVRENAVLAFHRSDGWVRVGFDEIRDPSGTRKSSWKDRKALHRKKIESLDSAVIRQRLRAKVKMLW
jgi:hypothetical protein